MNYQTIHKEFLKLKNPEKAKFLMGFFKTAPGQYGHGDRFLGITAPEVRALSKKYQTLSSQIILEFLQSPFNEERFFALAVWTLQYKKGSPEEKDRIFKTYLKNTKYINNWNLVDVSAPQIVGAHLVGENPALLEKLARSRILWKRRIGIVSTFALIRTGQVQTTLNLCRILLRDKEDLMHKACGWMLREVGKKDKKALIGFLNQYAQKMPRTMLRYSLEKLSKAEKSHYMQKT